MDLIERLHNCPHCGGTLQDDGYCRFCGSKVYDFVGIDVETSIDAFPTGTLEFIALGSTIIEDTKISGSEY